jgi:hypothetical protein
MADSTFADPDVTTFARLDGAGPAGRGTVPGAGPGDPGVPAVDADQRCRRCGGSGRPREHVWRHTRRGDKYVTVIIDLTPVREGIGPARLLDTVEGRSELVFKHWLADGVPTALIELHRLGRNLPARAGLDANLRIGVRDAALPRDDRNKHEIHSILTL